MKKLIALFACWGIWMGVVGQLYDAQWVIGPKTAVLDFRNDTVVIDTLPERIPFYLTSACISDSAGELLFTCYGSAVTDKYGNKLENGDSLSPCNYTYNHPDGFALPQAALFIPKPEDDRYYYLLHFSNDTLSNSRPATLYYSIIDKEGNFGLGEVVEKNHAFYKDIFRGGGMTACKHANGRDWWIIVGGRNNNRYNIFLLTLSGITDTLVQYIGPNYNGPFDIVYSCFSQDGTKYATIALEGYVTVFDFDRCSGTLSNPLTIFNNVSSRPLTDPITGGAGLAFSPNGRFIYVTGRLDLNQYDLLSTNIQDSVRIYTADSNDYAQIHFLELSPNGKLYGSTWSGGFYFLHVINKPDEKGDSCGFVHGGQPTLSNNSVNLPNMPNYRLGALLSSPCDTLTSLSSTVRSTKEKTIRLFPNPATDYAVVDYGFTDWSRSGDVRLEICDELGRIVYEQTLPRYSGFQKIDVSGFAAGVYVVAVKRGGEKVAVGKFAKE